MAIDVNIDASAYVKKTELPSNLTLYPTTVNSSVAGYNLLVTSMDDPNYNDTAVNISTPTINGTDILVAELATNAGVLVGSPGIVNLSTIGNVKRLSGTSAATFHYELYRRTSGGVETLLATSSDTALVDVNIFTQFSASAVLNDGVWSATDLIVIKYYGSKVGGGSNSVFQFEFGGTNPVRTIVPVPASVLVDVPVKNGVTDAIDFNEGDLVASVGGKTVGIDPLDLEVSIATQTALDGKQDLPTAGNSFVEKLTSAQKISGAKFNPISYINARGLSEYDGNNSYTALGVGLYEFNFTQKTIVRVIRTKISAPSNFEGTVSIYRGSSVNINPATHTLIETFTFKQGEFNSDSTAFAEVTLSQDALFDVGEYLYFYCVSTNNISPTVKRWTTSPAGSPSRGFILFSLNGTTWNLGTGTFQSASLLLLSQSDIDNTTINNKVKVLQNQNPRLTVPKKLYSFVGNEFDMYYDAMIMPMDKGLQSPVNSSVEVICTKGKLKERNFSFTPVIGDVGTVSATVNVYDKVKSLLKTQAITIEVVSTTPPSSAKNIAIIGDSTIANASVPTLIRNRFVTIGGTIPTFWGTQGTAPNKHEARSGWATSTFLGVSSPLMLSGSINIANYRSTLGMGASKFDLLLIDLGINDCFGALKTEAQMQTILTNFITIVNGFLADNASTKIIVSLPKLDSNTNGGWGDNYGATYSKASFQLNIVRLRELLLSTFDSSITAYANVQIGGIGLMVDRYWGYPMTTEIASANYSDTVSVHTNALHPRTEGYNQCTDAYFPQMLKILQP